MAKTANVYVRKLGTREIVKTIEVKLPISEGQHERLLMGMLRNMNTEGYFVDDGELDKAARG
jgi:hypothetical protein